MRRLLATEFGVTARFGYDGQAMISEHTATNQLTRRYVHGPGVDEPLVWYEGAGTTDRRWLHADERGSVIAVTNSAGAATIINSYDEYGIPGAANAGRFQYTGQAWLPELGLYHYKARAYSPTLGRFLQTDPIGYGDGMNMYDYVGGDPVNWVDPMGLCGGLNESGEVIVCANKYIDFIIIQSGGGGGGGGSIGGGSGQSVPDTSDEEIVVTATRKPEHDYRIFRRLTARNTACTLDQVSRAANDNSVPGSAGPHVSGEIYRASLFGISPGHIQFQAAADGRTFANITRDDHWLRYGTVVTTISGNQRDGFVAHVSGTGTNTNAFWAKVNDKAGPKILSMQLSSRHMAVLRACGG